MLERELRAPLIEEKSESKLLEQAETDSKCAEREGSCPEMLCASFSQANPKHGSSMLSSAKFWRQLQAAKVTNSLLPLSFNSLRVVRRNF